MVRWCIDGCAVLEAVTVRLPGPELPMKETLRSEEFWSSSHLGMAVHRRRLGKAICDRYLAKVTPRLRKISRADDSVSIGL
jgi:hypothetical protein